MTTLFGYASHSVFLLLWWPWHKLQANNKFKKEYPIWSIFCLSPTSIIISAGYIVYPHIDYIRLINQMFLKDLINPFLCRMDTLLMFLNECKAFSTFVHKSGMVVKELYTFLIKRLQQM